jgi:hypothetical protein
MALFAVNVQQSGADESMHSDAMWQIWTFVVSLQLFGRCVLHAAAVVQLVPTALTPHDDGNEP